MIIRELKVEDVGSVSELVLRSFTNSIADSLSEEGIASFAHIASLESFLARMHDDNAMFVCEQDGKIQGMIELKEGRHVAMLFVEPGNQRSGIGRRLLREALQSCRVEVITVSSSLTSVGAYLRYGFEIAGEQGESAGLK